MNVLCKLVHLLDRNLDSVQDCNLDCNPDNVALSKWGMIKTEFAANLRENTNL